jgi:hypothetical protein
MPRRSKQPVMSSCTSWRRRIRGKWYEKIQVINHYAVMWCDAVLLYGLMWLWINWNVTCFKSECLSCYRRDIVATQTGEWSIKTTAPNR